MDERTYARYMSDIAYFSSKLESDPDSKYFIPLCLAYNKMGKYDETVALCRKGVERFPNDCHSKVLLAEAYVYTGNPEAARDLLFEVIPEDPDNYKALKLLGVIYSNMEMPEEAVKYFRGAYFRSPEDPDLPSIIEELGGTIDPALILEERKKAAESDAVQDDEETKTYFEIDQKIKNAENMMAELVSDSSILKPSEDGDGGSFGGLISDEELNKLLEETGVAEEDAEKAPVSAGNAFADELTSVTAVNVPSADDTHENASMPLNGLSEETVPQEEGADLGKGFGGLPDGADEPVPDVAAAFAEDTGFSESEAAAGNPYGSADTDAFSEERVSDDADVPEEIVENPVSEILSEHESDAELFLNGGDSAILDNVVMPDETDSNTSDADDLPEDDKNDPASALIRALSGESVFSDNADSVMNTGPVPEEGGRETESLDDLAAVLASAGDDNEDTPEGIKYPANAENDSPDSDDVGANVLSDVAEKPDIFSLEDMLGDEANELNDQKFPDSAAFPDGDDPKSPAEGEEAAPFVQSGIFEEIMDAAETSSDMPESGLDSVEGSGLKALVRLNRENSAIRKGNREKSIEKLERKLEKIKSRSRR